MKKKFREMQTNMQDQMNPQQDFTAQPKDADKSTSKKIKPDYIDFEEIK